MIGFYYFFKSIKSEKKTIKLQSAVSTRNCITISLQFIDCSQQETILARLDKTGGGLQLRLGRQRQVWLIPIADERVGVQVKLWNPLRTRVIPERFCGGDSLRRGAISSVCTFTFNPIVSAVSHFGPGGQTSKVKVIGLESGSALVALSACLSTLVPC